MARKFPTIHGELLDIFARLERHYQDMCDTEFTIEQGKLWMLQTRVGKRTGAAALRMAVDMTKGTGKGKDRWKISRREALMRITADHLDQVLHPHFAGKAAAIAKGLGASPGRGRRQASYFTADEAADAADRGEKVILVRSRDQPGGRPRDDGVRGHPHRPRRARLARRRRGPRAGARPPWSAPRPSRSRARSSGSATSWSSRATSSRSTARPARSSSASSSWPRPSRRPSSRPSWAGPTTCAGASSRSGPTPTTAPTPRTPASSAPRASGCAGPSTCSSARTACPSSAG